MIFITWFAAFLDARTAVLFGLAAFMAWIFGWPKGAKALGGVALLLALSPWLEAPLINALAALPDLYLYAIALLVLLKSIWITLAAFLGVKLATRCIWAALQALVAMLLLPLLLLSFWHSGRHNAKTPRYAQRSFSPKERTLALGPVSPWVLNQGPIDILTRKLVLTNQRLLLQRGLLAKELHEWARRDITSVDLHQSWWGRITNSGDITVRARHQRPYRIEALVNPHVVLKLIRS